MRTTRVGALVAGSALSLGLLTVTAPAAQAATDPRPADIAASWLVGKLQGGLLQAYGAPDGGASIDAALALDEIGGHGTTVAKVADDLADLVSTDGYITGEAWGDAGSHYAGAIAKTAVMAQVAGAEETTFGGLDLLALLGDQMDPNGRLYDTSNYGDKANALGQAFAVRALAHAGHPMVDEALAYLLAQQCDDGGFREALAARDATDIECRSDASALDTTATVLLQLRAIADEGAAVTAAIGEAEEWLAQQQAANGSFGGGSDFGANANATGLAAWALAEGGDVAAAEKAAAWLRALQADDLAGCPTGLAGATGAVAYNAADFAAATSAGIAASQSYKWERATTQALPALVYASAAAAHALSLTGPTGYQAAGTTVRYRVAGALAGDVLCFNLGGAGRHVTAGPDGTAWIDAALPGTTAVVPVTISDRTRARTATTSRVLGAKKVPFRATKKVRRTKRLNVLVSGLAPGERVAVRFRGRLIRTGLATPAGTFIARVKVGKKLGKAKVRVTGEFPAIRNNAKTVRVVS